MNENFNADINFALKQAIDEAAKQGKTRLATWARDTLTNTYKSSFFRSELEDLNNRMADLAREEMQIAYKKGKKRGRKPYRQNDEGGLKRYSAGAMDKGLRSSNLIKASASGIQFNFDELNKYALQWARLNFGAGEAGSKQVKDEKIKIFRKSLADSPSLSGIGSRPGFLVPSNFGVVGVSSGTPFAKTPSIKTIVGTPKVKRYLYVYGKPGSGLRDRRMKQVKSKGILGWRFLDQGLNAMNKEYGREITALLETFSDDAKRAALKESRKQARVPRIRFKSPSEKASAQNRDKGGRFAPGYKPKFK
jgi:hypothetical protein